LSNTLSEDVDSRYKAITDSIPIVEFLDKSRSFLSKTHTTSNAPAPALTPATIAGATIAKTIIDIVHSAEAHPGVMRFNNARDDASLRVLAKGFLHVIQDKVGALKKLLAEAESGVIQASEKTKKFWENTLATLEPFLKVLGVAEKPLEELTETEKQERVAFCQVGKQAWEVNLPKVLASLSKEMVGPFALGDQFSTADLHLAAWFTRVAAHAGATTGDDGKTVVEKVEKLIGVGATVFPRDYSSSEQDRRGEKQAKLGVFWDALRERDSWQKIYGAGPF